MLLSDRNAYIEKSFCVDERISSPLARSTTASFFCFFRPPQLSFPTHLPTLSLLSHRRPPTLAARAAAGENDPLGQDNSGTTKTTTTTPSSLRQRLAAGALALALSAGAVSASASAASLSFLFLPRPAHAVTAEQLLFLEAWRAVDRAYVDKGFNGQSWFRLRERYLKDAKMDERGETYAAIRSALATLGDPFTRLLEPARVAALQAGRAGEVVGVGVEVAYGEEVEGGGGGKGSGGGHELVVVAPAPGGPADRAGVRAGDVIEAIDGTPTASLSIYEAGELLTGEAGSGVELRLRRRERGPALAQPTAVRLAREKVAFKPVASELCSDPDGDPSAAKTGYIRIASFSRATGSGAAQALSKLRADGATRFVLDVRDNGGGVFPAAVEVARQWLPPGKAIVLIADSAGVRDTYESTDASIVSSSSSAAAAEARDRAGGGAAAAASSSSFASELRAPLAVLVNRGTASAAEVLAGALHDNGRAAVFGERTFGKGLIQTVVPLSDGSAVAVTVARYQTPSGEDINKRGITPDAALPERDSLGFLPVGAPGFCKAYVGGGGAATDFLFSSGDGGIKAVNRVVEEADR